ncbi:MAG: SPOR domain-containing protein [Hyphomicrobiaceae bacterium]|nr:SPOR domain-containing protein [Hyphomicrobiaceae bacterium]
MRIRVMAAPVLATLLAVSVLPTDPAGAQQRAAETKSPKSPRKTSKPKSAKAPATPTEGSDKVDPEQTLDQARKALAVGNAVAAIAAAEKVLVQKEKTNRSTARALAVRGEARLKLGKVAEAMSDLDNALWVKDGLAPSERELAVSARADAFRQAGLAEPQGAPASSPQRTASAANGASIPPAAPAAGPPPSNGIQGGGVGGFFSNLLGLSGSSSGSGGSSQATAAIAPPKSPRVAATSSSAPQRAEGPTELLSDAGAPRKATAPPRAAAVTVPAAAAATAAAGGTFRLQLAAVRSKPEATALANKVSKLQPDVLKGRNVDVEETVFGNMGRFFRARIGPFASRIESEAICASVRQKGHDCMVVEK